MLLGLLDQGMIFALRVTARQAQASSSSADLPVVDAALRRLVANADPGVYPEPASLRGTSTSLSMITQAPGADGGRHPVDAVLFATGGSLQLRWGAHRHVESFGSPSPAENVVLLSGVDGLVIDYAATQTGEWRSNWTAEILPSLVRIRLLFASRAQQWPPIIVAPRLEAPGQ